MKIVIDIDEKLYARIKYLEPKADTMLDNLMRAVQNGTPLPKGHGKLIDAGLLRNQFPIWIDNFSSYVVNNTISNAPTIIEAESEG